MRMGREPGAWRLERSAFTDSDFIWLERLAEATYFSVGIFVSTA